MLETLMHSNENQGLTKVFKYLSRQNNASFSPPGIFHGILVGLFTWTTTAFYCKKKTYKCLSNSEYLSVSGKIKLWQREKKYH